MEQVELTYQAWFRVFKETVVPRLISQPKWFRVDKDLKEKDLVYFQKEESALGSTWTIGQVDQVIASKDGLIRRAVIKYFNPNENHPRFTDRSARKLVKLWSLDESCLFDDLNELHQRLHAKDAGQVDEAQLPVEPDQVPGVAAQHCGRAPRNEVGQEAVATSFSPLFSYIAGLCDESTLTNSSGEGPTYVTLDGVQLDMLAMTTSCELASLRVRQQGHVEDLAEGVEEQVGNLDTLHSVLVSTGFSLE